MGRKSPKNKRQRRQRQKQRKKFTFNAEKLSSVSSNSSLGSPSSPPSVPSDYSTFNHLSAEMTNLYGIDTEILTYHEDESSNFEMEDGKILTGDQLTTHLRKYNKILANKAKLYQQKFEDLLYENRQKEVECAANIREFYQNLIYYSNSRSATMVKMAISRSGRKKKA